MDVGTGSIRAVHYCLASCVHTFSAPPSLPTHTHAFTRMQNVIAQRRPELAMCLLSEVAFACHEEFRGCLPLLLHACAVLLDSGEAGCTYCAACCPALL